MTPRGAEDTQRSQGSCSGGMGGGEEGAGGSQHSSTFQGCGTNGEFGVQAGNILLMGHWRDKSSLVGLALTQARDKMLSKHFHKG